MPISSRLLYISPVLPSAGGSGVAMRSGIVLEALSERHCVSVLVASIYPALEDERFLMAHCDRAIIVPPGSAAPEALQIARDAYRDEHFDVVHVYRLAALAFAKTYLKRVNGRPALHLDLDDIDSIANRRLAQVYRISGDEEMARRTEMRAERSLALESAAFQMFDRVYVCSEHDRKQLLGRCAAETRVLKNAIRIPDDVAPASDSALFRFLFVGTLGYYPNKDAVRFFCSEVLPLVRQLAPGPFTVNIVGSGYSDDLQDLNAVDVRIIGRVADVRPWYESSHAVIVPIRTGGGTRIKILEAFSYQRPVISTSIGAEGLDAESDQHLLIADTPEAFSSACVRLMSDSSLRQTLVDHAARLLLEQFTIEALRTTLA